MPAESAPRRWTVATWLLAHAAEPVPRVVDALDALDADAVALQSVRERQARHIGDRLDFHRVWTLSHHPKTPLLPGRGVGLAVLTPHQIGDTASVVISEHSSPWSRHRRIAQVTVVHRSDHTGYAIGHAVGLAAETAVPSGSAPLVRFVPEQVGRDDRAAVQVPGAATVIETAVSEPVPGAAPLLVTTFEMPWVQGDLPPV